MRVLGIGLDTMRYQAEIAVRGTIAYTLDVERAPGRRATRSTSGT